MVLIYHSNMPFHLQSGMTAGEAVFELLTKDDQAEKSVYNMEMIDYEEELHAPMQATKYQEVIFNIINVIS